MCIPTAHIGAKEKGQIAKTLLMPGDPLRAKFIAENFLADPVQYTGVRGMLGYTGTYKGVPVSVQGSGMGNPSMGIYSYELYKYYEVENIIRVGTAGALHPDLKLKDIVFAMSASTNSSYATQYNLKGYPAPAADFQLLRTAVSKAEAQNLPYKVGNILSSDYFYTEDVSSTTDWMKLGILAVEMESAALYLNAMHLGKRALCILTISDLINTQEATTSEERETAFTDMMHVALETAASL